MWPRPDGGRRRASRSPGSEAWTRAISWRHPHPFQHLGKNSVRVEVLLRNRSGRLCMPLVVGSDLLGVGHGLVQRSKGEEAFTNRQRPAEACVLNQYGLPGGQVSDRAVAEPATSGVHVDPLSHRELGPRAMHVAAELSWPCPSIRPTKGTGGWMDRASSNSRPVRCGSAATFLNS